MSLGRGETYGWKAEHLIGNGNVAATQIRRTRFRVCTYPRRASTNIQTNRTSHYPIKSIGHVQRLKQRKWSAVEYRGPELLAHSSRQGGKFSLVLKSICYHSCSDNLIDHMADIAMCTMQQLGNSQCTTIQN